MNCKICGHGSEKLFSAKVLGKYEVQFFRCPDCEYIFTEEPFWLSEAYSRPINISDTGLLDRNIYFGKLLSILIYFWFGKDKSFVDYAGGYGIFTRFMRDVGFDFYWYDPYCENILAKGFEFIPAIQNNIRLLTAFEVFEHFVNPLDEIGKMLSMTRNIAFSTQLIPKKVPLPDEWDYYSFEHGQHISFYSKKTLEVLADKFKLHYYNYEYLHLFSEIKMSRSVFRLLMSLKKLGMYSVIKKIMQSKIMEDQTELIKKQN